ncbi:hypothetical protein DFH27DRAFT_652069 [Peziza echinospora]|nr:hypothetical protein DFH27DRAFT_652069 [Peziza echinospora]
MDKYTKRRPGTTFLLSSEHSIHTQPQSLFHKATNLRSSIKTSLLEANLQRTPDTSLSLHLGHMASNVDIELLIRRATGMALDTDEDSDWESHEDSDGESHEDSDGESHEDSDGESHEDSDGDSDEFSDFETWRLWEAEQHRRYISADLTPVDPLHPFHVFHDIRGMYGDLGPKYGMPSDQNDPEPDTSTEPKVTMTYGPNDLEMYARLDPESSTATEFLEWAFDDKPSAEHDTKLKEAKHPIKIDPDFPFRLFTDPELHDKANRLRYIVHVIHDHLHQINLRKATIRDRFVRELRYRDWVDLVIGARCPEDHAEVSNDTDRSEAIKLIRWRDAWFMSFRQVHRDIRKLNGQKTEGVLKDIAWKLRLARHKEEQLVQGHFELLRWRRIRYGYCGDAFFEHNRHVTYKFGRLLETEEPSNFRAIFILSMKAFAEATADTDRLKAEFWDAEREIKQLTMSSAWYPSSIERRSHTSSEPFRPEDYELGYRQQEDRFDGSWKELHGTTCVRCGGDPATEFEFADHVSKSHTDNSMENMIIQWDNEEKNLELMTFAPRM